MKREHLRPMLSQCSAITIPWVIRPTKLVSFSNKFMMYTTLITRPNLADINLSSFIFCGQIFGIQLVRSLLMSYIPPTTLALTFALWSSTWQEKSLTPIWETGMVRCVTSAHTSLAFASQTKLICLRRQPIAATNSSKKSAVRSSSYQRPMVLM